MAFKFIAVEADSKAANKGQERKTVDPVHLSSARRVVEFFETRAIHEKDGEYSIMLMRLRRDASLAKAIRCGIQTAIARNKQIASVSKDKNGRNVLDDCLPCLKRIKDFKVYNPINGLLSIFDTYLDSTFSNLSQLLTSLLNNGRSFNLLCSLLKMLRKKCLPDISAMIGLLSFYIKDIVSKLKEKISIKVIFGFAIKMLIKPLAISFGFLDNFIQMIMGVIDCLINDANKQLKKLDRLVNIENEFKKKKKKKVDTTIDKSKVKNKLLGDSSPIAQFIDMIKDAQSRANKKIQNIIDFINQTLNIVVGDTEDAINEINRLKSAIAIIGILKTIFNDLKDGKICSNHKLNNFQKAKHFIIANAQDVIIETTEDIITIKRPAIPIDSELIDIVRDIEDIIVISDGDKHTIKLRDTVIRREQCNEISGDEELITWANQLNRL